jgi:hypothetical protein
MSVVHSILNGNDSTTEGVEELQSEVAIAA